MKIFSGDSNHSLAAGIMRELAADDPYTPANLGNVYLHTFPSGESYCQFKENIRGEDVFLIQSISRPANDYLMQLLVMVDAARRASAERITAVIPYFGYARQDRKEKGRVPISIKLVLDLLTAAGVDRILTMDLHNPAIAGMTNLPFDHLFSAPIFSKYLLEQYGQDKNKLDRNKFIVLSPDVGGVKRAEGFATELGVDFGFIVKERVGDTEVKAEKIVGDVKDKHVLIVDDVTESCGTILQAVDISYKNGATAVESFIAHGCLTDTGVARMMARDKADFKMFTSNSVERAYSVHQIPFTKWDNLSVAPMFAQAIKAIHQNNSVSVLF